MEPGFSPLDEELEILPGSLTPLLHEQLVRLGTWMPFARAVGEFANLIYTEVSEPTARRDTEAAGAALVAAQEAEVERLVAEAPAPPAGPEVGLFSVDGAMVPLVGGEWAEVKTLTLGEVVAEGGEVHTRQLSYFSRLADAERFTHQALGEAHRRGVETAGRVVAVSDGAEWIDKVLAYHRPDAVRVLDYAHAATRLYALAEAIGGTEAVAWGRELAGRLLGEGPAGVLEAVRARAGERIGEDPIREHLGYLTKRQGRMDYPHYRAQGWPIGSGAAESANKLVVEARLKGSGMHWARPHVDPLLALRDAMCSGRWEECWAQIVRERRRQAGEGRLARHRARLAPPTPATEPSPPPAVGTTAAEQAPKEAEGPLVAEGSSAEVPSPAAQTPRKPGPDHPWHAPAVLGVPRLPPRVKL